MKNFWTFKNCFTSNLLNKSEFFVDKINFKKFESFDNSGKLIYSNIEIIENKSSIIDTKMMKGNLEMIENDWKYPFPNNYIPVFYENFKLDMSV